MIRYLREQHVVAIGVSSILIIISIIEQMQNTMHLRHFSVRLLIPLKQKSSV